jgi:dephospho-CoA kinase
MKLIALAGTNGAGKDTVAELIAKEHNYLFISVSDLLRQEAAARGVTTDRKNLRTISAEWRRQHGLGALIDKAVENYEAAGGDTKFSGLVVSSVRNKGEVDRVHDFDGKLLWIDADSRVRFTRITSRNRDDDPQNYDDFLKQQEAEMVRSGDEATLSLSEVRTYADSVFINNHGDIASLNNAIAQELERIS